MTAPVSCTEAVLSYNKQQEWRREKVEIESYKMGTQVRRERRGVRRREQDCPVKAL